MRSFRHTLQNEDYEESDRDLVIRTSRVGEILCVVDVIEMISALGPELASTVGWQGVSCLSDEDVAMVFCVNDTGIVQAVFAPRYIVKLDNNSGQVQWTTVRLNEETNELRSFGSCQDRDEKRAHRFHHMYC